MNAQQAEWAETAPISSEEAQYLAGTGMGVTRAAVPRMQGRYMNIKTEAQAQYTGEFAPATRVNKAHYVHQPQPFQGTSTAQDDYKYWGSSHPRKPSQLARGNNGIFSNNLPFQGTSTAKADFLKWSAPPAKLARESSGRPVYVPDNRSFATEASLQFEYKKVRPRASCAPQIDAAVSVVPFDGQTTAQSDFVEFNTKPARSYQRQRTWRPRGEDRAFKTEARAQFYEKATGPLHRATKGGVRPAVSQLPDGTWGMCPTGKPGY